jgi:hypothetical protein
VVELTSISFESIGHWNDAEFSTVGETVTKRIRTATYRKRFRPVSTKKKKNQITHLDLILEVQVALVFPTLLIQVCNDLHVGVNIGLIVDGERESPVALLM